MKLLLITGIPGTGKTTIGDYLQEKYGFIHLDVEKIIFSHGNNSWQFLIDTISKAKELNLNTVITWGFMPGQDNNLVFELQKMGAKMIWFDGNRQAAEKAFVARGTVSKLDFDKQMGQINKADIIGTFNPVVLDTFRRDDSFLPKDKIARKLLKL
jgi:hypothetical protein